MKPLSILFICILSVFLVKCTMFDKPIKYVFETGSGDIEESFLEASGDSSKSTLITIRTSELRSSKNDPITIDYIFSETTPHVKKLQSIKVVLLTKNKSNEFVELPSSSGLTIEYYNGKNQIKSELKNSNEIINSLIDWKEANYSYEFNGVNYIKEDNYITFSGTYNFTCDDYPDELKLLATFQWEGSTKKIEKKLHKTKYSGPKFNPKY